MITDSKNQKRYTTAEAAAMLDKPINTIRVYATRHDLGIWIGNQRFLSDADIAKLAGARRGPRPKSQPQPASTPP